MDVTNIRIKKCDTVVSVDDRRLFSSEFEAAVIDGVLAVIAKSPVARYNWEYGLRQILNDQLSAFSETPKAGSATTRASKTDMLAIVNRKLEAMYNGDIRVAVSADASVEGLAYKIASDMVAAAWSRKHPDAKLSEFKNRHEVTTKFLEGHPEIMEAAKAQFGAKSDLDDLV